MKISGKDPSKYYFEGENWYYQSSPTQKRHKIKVQECNFCFESFISYGSTNSFCSSKCKSRKFILSSYGEQKEPEKIPQDSAKYFKDKFGFWWRRGSDGICICVVLECKNGSIKMAMFTSEPE